MAKITSNEYVKVLWVPDAYLTNAQAAHPTVAQLTAPQVVDLSPAIAWSDFELGASDSEDIEDRGITDSGNAVSRGFSNFTGTLSFFRDANPDDTTSDYNIAWDTFKIPRTYGYLVIRVAEKRWDAPIAAGDRVSLFRFCADVIVDDTEGDDSVKFTVTYLPQGFMFPYATVQANSASVLGNVAATRSASVGSPYVLLPTLDGKDVRVVSSYTSSDSTKATVSTNGVVTPVAAGTVTISVNNPSASSAATQTLTVS